MARKVGIRELARHLDISIGTISRALNGRADVNEETRKRVLEAAEKLGYVANQSGRSLRQGVTNIVGFMIEAQRDTSAHGDPFFSGVFDGVQSVLRDHQLDLVVLLCSSDDNPGEYMRRMMARGFVDAFIVSATQRIEPRFEYLAAAHIPFVALGRSDTPTTYPWIDLDFEGFVRISIQRLRDRGYKRIAIAVTNTEINLSYILRRTWHSAMIEFGLEADPSLMCPTTSDERGGYDILPALLEAQADAVLLGYEVMAIGLYRHMAERNLQPGVDLGIIGFRDNPQTRFLTPPLTCFNMDLRTLGGELARSVLSLLPATADIYPRRTGGIIWPMTLSEGESDVPRA